MSLVPDSASVGGEDPLAAVVVFAVLGAALALLWQHAGVVDAGHAGGALAAGEGLDLESQRETPML